MRTITIDTTEWTREEEQLIPSAIVGMLYEGGHAYVPGSVKTVGDGVYSVDMDGEFPFTSEQIRQRIHDDDAKRTDSALDETP